MARVLVTGPTGASGQYVLERLMTTGHDVRVLALPNSIHRMNFRDRIEIIPGHLHDRTSLDEALEGVEIVFHTALISPPPALTPERMMQVNGEGTAELVKAAWGKVRRFVLVSSNNVFSPHRSPAVWPLRDDALRMPHGNPQQIALGESLIAAEDAVFDAAEQGAFEHCTLRPTVVSGRSGGFIDQMVTGLIRGTANMDISRRMWDVMQWIHGSDLARAAILVSEAPEAANKCFTVAGDQPVTIYDIQSLTWELMNIGRPGNPYAETAAQNNIGLPKFDFHPAQGARLAGPDGHARMPGRGSRSARIPFLGVAQAACPHGRHLTLVPIEVERRTRETALMT